MTSNPAPGIEPADPDDPGTAPRQVIAQRERRVMACSGSPPSRRSATLRRNVRDKLIRSARERRATSALCMSRAALRSERDPSFAASSSLAISLRRFSWVDATHAISTAAASARQVGVPLSRSSSAASARESAAEAITSALLSESDTQSPWFRIAPTAGRPRSKRSAGRACVCRHRAATGSSSPPRQPPRQPAIRPPRFAGPPNALRRSDSPAGRRLRPD